MKNKFAALFTSKEIYSKILIVLIGLYFFTTASFSGRPYFNYIPYGFVALLGVYVCLICIVKKKIFFSWTLIWYPLFIFVSFISTIIGTRSFGTLFTMSLLLISSLILFEGMCLIDNPKLVIYSVIIAGGAFATYFLVIYGRDIIKGNYTRLGSYFDNENTVGTFFLLLSVLSLSLAVNNKKWLFIIPSLIFAALAYTTASKKVFIGLLVAVLTSLYFFFEKKKLVFIVALFGTLLTALLLLQIPAVRPMRDRIMETFLFFLGAKQNGSDYQRTLYLGNSFYFGGENFFIGLGGNGFATYSQFKTYSHNNFGEVFCDFGILGLTAFTSIFVSLVVSCSPSKTFESALVKIWVVLYVALSIAFVYFDSKLFLFLLPLMQTISHKEALERKQHIVVNPVKHTVEI